MMLQAMKDGGIAHYAFNLSRSLGAHSVPVDLYTTAGYEFTQTEYDTGEDEKSLEGGLHQEIRW